MVKKGNIKKIFNGERTSFFGTVLVKNMGGKMIFFVKNGKESEVVNGVLNEPLLCRNDGCRNSFDLVLNETQSGQKRKSESWECPAQEGFANVKQLKRDIRVKRTLKWSKT